MTDPATKDMATKGMATRRRVLGDAHVNRAEAGKTAADAAFQALITDAAWGMSGAATPYRCAKGPC